MNVIQSKQNETTPVLKRKRESTQEIEDPTITKKLKIRDKAT